MQSKDWYDIDSKYYDLFNVFEVPESVKKNLSKSPVFRQLVTNYHAAAKKGKDSELAQRLLANLAFFSYGAWMFWEETKFTKPSAQKRAKDILDFIADEYFCSLAEIPSEYEYPDDLPKDPQYLDDMTLFRPDGTLNYEEFSRRWSVRGTGSVPSVRTVSRCIKDLCESYGIPTRRGIHKAARACIVRMLREIILENRQG